MSKPSPRFIAALLAVALVLAGCSSDEPEVNAQQTVPTVDPASTSCEPALDPYSNHVAYAREKGAIGIYPEPGAEAPMVALENPRKTDTDPPVEVDLIFLVTAEPEDNCDWVEVMLPIRPNGSKGWVKRSDIKMEGNSYRMEVDLDAFNLKAYVGDELVLDAPIGVGVGDTPTPPGTYYTTELLQPPDPDSVYGSFAYGLSGHSEVLTSFNGGQGQLGIHGTNDPETIGTTVSKGCIRLTNENIEKLTETFQTPYGIRVDVVA